MQKSVIELVKQAGLAPETLAGKTAFVTGAGGGIGRTAAQALAWLGSRVVIAELDEMAGLETQALIERTGGMARFICMDVSDEAAVRQAAAEAARTFGPVEILVNNAILCPVAEVAEMELALWDRVVAVNLRGAFLTCQAFLPGMLAAQRGVIVNMVSADAMPGLGAYIATKQGLVGLSQSLALEVRERGVRVIPFVPGMVDTPGIRGVAGALAPLLGLTETQFLSLPLHHAFEGLMPVEYAGAATAYLISQLADEFHGQVVNGYEVLERAGLIEAARLPEDARLPARAAPETVNVPVLAQELVRMLAETEAELNQLPVFVRPLARSGFKSKSGASLGDWQRLLAAIEAGQPPAPDLPARLDLLAFYFREVPQETARFVKDADTLRQITAVSQERQAAVQALRQAVLAG